MLQKKDVWPSRTTRRLKGPYRPQKRGKERTYLSGLRPQLHRRLGGGSNLAKIFTEKQTSFCPFRSKVMQKYRTHALNFRSLEHTISVNIISTTICNKKREQLMLLELCLSLYPSWHSTSGEKEGTVQSGASGCEKRFCQLLSESSSCCLLSSTAQQPQELSENILLNLFHNLTPHTVVIFNKDA